VNRIYVQSSNKSNVYLNVPALLAILRRNLTDNNNYKKIKRGRAIKIRQTQHSNIQRKQLVVEIESKIVKGSEH